MTIPADIVERASRVRLACFDVDGTLTDGRLWFGAQGEETKAFHIHDGLGLRLLEDHGIAVALVTARDSAAARTRAADLRLSHVLTGARDKRSAVQALIAERGLQPDEVAFMGDDLLDLPAFALVGLAAAPADAHAWTRERAHWVAPAPGGAGAARALCDLILEARGLRAAIVDGYAGR